MRRLRTRLLPTLSAAGAVIVAALVGGTLISAAAANQEPTDASGGVLSQEGGGEYCQLYLDTLAAELGVSADALVPAARAAATATLQAMTDAGDLPAEIGERMLQRLENAEGDGCWMLGPRFGHAVRHAAHAEFLEGMWQAAAEALNLTPEELRTQVRDGSSLEEIAEAQGVDYATVSAAIIDSASDDLNAAVEAGRITQERADRILERIQTWLDAGGQPPHRRVAPEGSGLPGLPFGGPGLPSGAPELPTG